LFAANILISGQVYNPVNYNYNGTPTYGIKIKTNLPFSNGSQMPTLIIEGLNYGRSRPTGIMLTWYIYDGRFWSPKISSYGADNPKIMLSNEGGKVVVFIDEKNYFQRFSIRAFAQGMSEQSDWFANWQTVDEPLSGLNTVEVPYENSFKGIVNFPNGIWNADGSVGIGTTNPTGKLEISGGNIILNRPSNKVDRNGISEFSAFEINNSFTPGQTGYVKVYYPTNNSLLFGADYDGHIGGAQPNIQFGRIGNPFLTVVNNGDYTGNVGIGTTNPDEKLTVNGVIHAKEVKVDLSGPLADFVFKPDYKLMSLPQVEQFVKANNRLPQMPSAEEVTKNGLSMGEMQNKLLQKVEELTLYVIEQQKTISQQQSQLKELNDKFNNLKSNDEISKK
jgi:hypothetical protein